MGNLVDENLNFEKDRYERQRRRENENRLSNNIYRIDYENYLKRKRDSEGKVAELLSIVEEKRALLEKEKAEKDRVNSHGDYYYRNRIKEKGAIYGGGSVIWLIVSFFFAPAIFLPIAAKLNFGVAEMAAVLIMLGAPTTPSCFIMAKNMGHEGMLTASIVALTTVLSAFTVTFWVFVMKTFGWI